MQRSISSTTFPWKETKNRTSHSFEIIHNQGGNILHATDQQDIDRDIEPAEENILEQMEKKNLKCSKKKMKKKNHRN
jgi:hypothetical protein